MSITVRKANVVLDIAEDQKDRFISEGYSVINAVTGAIIEKALPKDIPSLQHELQLALDKCGTLELKIEALELAHDEVVKKLKADVAKSKKVEKK